MMLFIWLILLTAALGYAATERPNIVIIIADDMGWNDVGFLGSEIPTPNIDALAYNGIIIDRHYASPACSPSRGSLFTGKYSSRIAMQGRPIAAGVPLGLDLKEKILPQYFKDLGYSTHLVGKWHLGMYTPAHLPTNRGFDTFFGFLNGYLGYYDGTHHDNGISGIDSWRNTSKVWNEFFNNYLTTLLAEEAVDIIGKHAANGKRDGLFLVVGSSAPHRGNRAILLEPPPFTYGDRLNNITDPNRRLYADIMLGLDMTVGNVFEALSKNNMINNSIILFFSDNGAPTTDDLWHFNNHGSNWPLRGEKMSVYEGGVRTPAAIWSSTFIHSKVHQGLFHISDWLPTLYAAAGGNVNDLSDLDGINQLEALTSDKEMNNLRKELLAYMDDVDNIEAYIKGKWKLVRNYSPNRDKAFTDGYFGKNLRGIIEYNKTEIINSKVGISLTGSELNDSTIEKLRQQVIVQNYCSDFQRAGSALSDCYSKYCLYNIEEDPEECYDLASSNIEIVKELNVTLEQNRKQLVKRGKFIFDRNGFPGETNYWEPWIKDVAPKNNIPELIISVSIALLITVLYC